MAVAGSAVPQPNAAVLARGHDLAARIAAIEAEVRELASGVTAANAGRLIESQLYRERVLASLQSARVDLGTLALIVAQDGSP